MPDRNTPMYARIMADIRGEIAAGTLALGDRLPPEAALCERYGVSRMTVRHAVDGLVAAGLLKRRRGVGTFVSRTKTERVASRLLGFREDALAHGLTPTTEVLSTTTEALGAEDGAILDLPPTTRVLRVGRRRSTDGEAIGLNTVVLVPPFATLLRELDFSGSLYEAVAAALGTEVAGAAQTVEAVVADAPTAAILEVQSGAALLRVTRATYLEDGRTLGLTRTLYRGDRYFLSLQLERGEPRPP